MNHDEAKALERDLRYGGYNQFVCIAVEERGRDNWIVVLWGDHYSTEKKKEYPC